MRRAKEDHVNKHKETTVSDLRVCFLITALQICLEQFYQTVHLKCVQFILRQVYFNRAIKKFRCRNCDPRTKSLDQHGVS